jgi:hypothetical protein
VFANPKPNVGYRTKRKESEIMDTKNSSGNVSLHEQLLVY